ncbi:MAG TPA: hypothetical protein VD867_07325, partial [Burkholderiales bacterium]|nr:hypothetical protein [Burkholderiales bacterium]
MTPIVFLVTPNPTDAEVGMEFLREAGIQAEPCSSLGDLCRVPFHRLGCAVLVEEAMVHPDI